MFSPIEKLFSTSDFSDFLFNNFDASICLIDVNLRLLRENDAFKKLFHTTTDAESENVLFGNAVNCKYVAQTNKLCGETESCLTCPVYDSIKIASGSGKKINRINQPWEFTENGKRSVKYVQFTCIPLIFWTMPYILIIIHIVNGQEKRGLQIKELSDRDFLTGLAGRSYLYDVCECYFLTAKRGYINFSVCMIDVDLFGTVNNTYGCKAGDFVLRELVSVIKENLRQSDFLARYNGEQFCLLFQYKKTTDVFGAAEKLRSQVETHEFSYKEKKLHVTISIGATVKRGHSTDALINKACSLLRAAKKKGRNRVELEAWVRE